MPGEGRAVHKQRVVPDHTVVSYMGVRQKEIAITHFRFAAALLRSSADRHVFAENVVVADNQFGTLPAKGVILRIAADRAE